MTQFKPTLIAALLSALVWQPAVAAPIHWSQNLHNEEWIALGFKKPVVVMFVGNGKFDAAAFKREGLDSIGDMAEFVWVGADLQDKVTPDQIALEHQYNVTKFPTLIVLRAVKTGTDSKGDHYSFREVARCVENGEPCGQDIVLAVETGMWG